jgi:Fibronectin type III domain./Clostridium neurotoxin, N-terminal receptor binding.
MRNFILRRRGTIMPAFLCFLLLTQYSQSLAQTLAFPGATGFGRYAKGARAVSNPQVYVVTNLNDAGPGSFRDAVSQPGRIVVFAVGGIVHLGSNVQVAPNTTIAAQTAPGDGIVFFGKRITFTGSSNTIARYLRVRLGATGNSGNDASGLANGSNIILDHMSFTWGMDEVFSINWDNKGVAPDSITVQNSIIGQGLHRENHSAGGLIQTPDGGKVSLIRNLYISNKTRNPKVKGVNEFVNNVVYNWGNGNRLGDIPDYGWSGEAYIMGGSSGVSEVNIINNYFVSGPLTPPDENTPFSRGTGTFYLYGAGNYFDHNKNGALDGVPVPYDTTGYPGIAADGFKTQPFPYPQANPAFTAAQAYAWVIDSVGACYPRRDQVDALLASEVASRGTQGYYVYRETDLPFSNGGLGDVFGAPAPLDTDQDGMPDAWEDAHGLNKNDAQDAVMYNGEYLNIEHYINSVINTPTPSFIRPPSNLVLQAVSPSQVNISWNDNSDDEDYFLLERSTDGSNFSDIAQVTGTTWTDSTVLQPNQSYWYRVKAVNATDASVYSAVVSVKTPPLPSAPAPASAPVPGNGFQYAETAGGSLTLKWTGSENTDSFFVYFGKDSLVLQAVVTNPSYTVNGLVDSTTYQWRIDSKNELGLTVGDTWTFRTIKSFPQTIVGHYSFDETEGRQVTDSSEFENHGVLGLDDDDQGIRVPGKINNALNFATADQNMYVVSVPHQEQLYLDKNSFSLSFWMKADPSLLPPDNNSSAYLLCKGSITRNAGTGATGKRFDIEFKNKQIRFAIDDDNDGNGGGKDELQSDGTPFFSGQWVHVTVIRDTTVRKLRLFMNGALIKETNITRALSGIGEASDLIIGNIGELEFLSTANKPAPYKGMLDELKIFNYALTNDQVLELFHTSPLPLQPYSPSLVNGAMLEGYGDSVRLAWKGGLKTSNYKLYIGTDSASLAFVKDAPLNGAEHWLTNLNKGANYYWRVDAIGEAGTTTGEVWMFRAVSPKGLVGHWSFNDSSVADHSVYHHDGTIVNMPEAAYVPGRQGTALHFNNAGGAAAVAVPHAEHLQFDANSFTISLWVKLNSSYSASAGKDCYLIHKGQFTDPGGKWYGLQLKDSVLTFAIDDASSKTNIDVSLRSSGAYAIFNNTWSHIMAVKDTAARQIRLYINGALAGSKAYSSTGTTGKALPLLIGNSAENRPFHDMMDDVRLYNYVLSPEEMDLLLCRGALPAPTIAVSRTDNTYTGGDANTIYLGYDARQLHLAASYPTAAQFTWSPGAGLSDSTVANPVFAPTVAGNYTFTVTAVNEFGCSTADSITIKVKDVRCGNRKVTMCYLNHELCIDRIAVPILQLLGAKLGKCQTAGGRVVQNSVVAPSFKVYPVPASHHCTVQFSLEEPGMYRVEIYNAHGQLMQVAGKGQAGAQQVITLPVNSSRLTNGVYYVKLVTQKSTKVQPMIIQR